MNWIFWTCGAVVLLILGVSYCCYWMAFYNPESRHAEAVNVPVGNNYDKIGNRVGQLYREMEEVPYERVFIQSRDGLRLSARYYHVHDGAPVQIQFHGYRGSGIRDFCGGNMLARKAGHNTLLVDQRAHGESQGNTMTFGVRERYDCLDWVDYVLERFGADTQVFLAGVSMGAATVLMASALPLPENVLGIIADCPYSSPGGIIRKVIADMKLPPKLGYPFVVLGGLIFGRFRVWEASCVEAVKQANIPILLIHGAADKFVPCQMSREIYAACASDKFLELYPDAGHGISFAVDEARYEKMLNRFYEFCLHH